MEPFSAQERIQPRRAMWLQNAQIPPRKKLSKVWRHDVAPLDCVGEALELKRLPCWAPPQRPPRRCLPCARRPSVLFPPRRHSSCSLNGRGRVAPPSHRSRILPRPQMHEVRARQPIWPKGRNTEAARARAKGPAGRGERTSANVGRAAQLEQASGCSCAWRSGDGAGASAASVIYSCETFHGLATLPTITVSNNNENSFEKARGPQGRLIATAFFLRRHWTTHTGPASRRTARRRSRRRSGWSAGRGISACPPGTPWVSWTPSRARSPAACCNIVAGTVNFWAARQQRKGAVEEGKWGRLGWC